LVKYEAHKIEILYVYYIIFDYKIQYHEVLLTYYKIQNRA